MSRVLVLAIDALDRGLIDLFAADLPNLSALRRRASVLPVATTFPPDSDTAWATAVTGLSPAQHGVLRFIDPIRKSYEILNVGSQNSELGGKTIWDTAGRAGRRCIVVFPHLGYPLWPLPPTVSAVVRSPTAPEVSADPASLLASYPDRKALLGVRGFPGRRPTEMAQYRDRLHAQALADARFGLNLIEARPWDLFFAYWSMIDAVGHFFWNYHESTQLRRGHENGLAEVIRDTYRLFDQIIGWYLEKVEHDTSVIVISDHGHGGRPFKLLNVNEILRRRGLLRVRDPHTHPHLRLVEQTKRLAVHAVSRYGLGRMAGRIVRRFPSSLDAFTRPASIDWKRTVAYASDMSGIKAYPYGGITINRDLVATSHEYEAIRQRVIEALQQHCDDGDGRPLLEFARRREELDSGPYLDRYPDVVVQLKREYGLGWAVNSGLTGLAASRNLVPGSHRSDTATFMMQTDRRVRRPDVNLLDLAPTVLDLLGLPHDEGRSILG